jgi:hypothetical protein
MSAVKSNAKYGARHAETVAPSVMHLQVTLVALVTVVYRHLTVIDRATARDVATIRTIARDSSTSTDHANTGMGEP